MKFYLKQYVFPGISYLGLLDTGQWRSLENQGIRFFGGTVQIRCVYHTNPSKWEVLLTEYTKNLWYWNIWLSDCYPPAKLTWNLKKRPWEGLDRESNGSHPDGSKRGLHRFILGWTKHADQLGLIRCRCISVRLPKGDECFWQKHMLETKKHM